MKKLALITGAASGIGREFSKIHASKGGNIIAVDLNSKGLKKLKTQIESEFNVQVYTIEKDLSKLAATKEIYDEIKREGFEIDFLINNAGFGGIGKFHERPWEKDLAMIQVNILALTSLTRYFLPEFVQRNSGKILNVSSTASLIPGPLQAVYFATKAYVTSFSNALSGELYDANVSVTALLPGPTKTNFGASSGMDKTPIYQNTAAVSDVAKDGYDAMMQGKLEVISGLPWSQRLQLSMAPLIPKKLQLQIVRKGQEV